MDPMSDPEALLTPQELSEHWQGKVSTQTIAQWRFRKTGPAYRKLGGKVVYRMADVRAYEQAMTRGKAAP